MLAGFLEEICQIHFPSAVRIPRKTDCLDERFVGIIRVEKGAMNTAKVDKIERGASHDEHWFKLVKGRRFAKIQDSSAVLVHGELADSAEFSLHKRLICERLGAEGNVAASTECFLLLFGLNG